MRSAFSPPGFTAPFLSNCQRVSPHTCRFSTPQVVVYVDFDIMFGPDSGGEGQARYYVSLVDIRWQVTGALVTAEETRLTDDTGLPRLSCDRLLQLIKGMRSTDLGSGRYGV
jgi:hypothetical protein